MRRVLCVLITTVCMANTCNIMGQDFADKFISELASDGDKLNCQTISPKMMERMMSLPNSKNENKTNGRTEEDILTESLLTKIKSARIVTATDEGEEFFDKAVDLLKRNTNRFTPLNPKGKNRLIFVRKHEDVILELVMLNLNLQKDTLIIVDFTGEMDKTFINTLTKAGRK